MNTKRFLLLAAALVAAASCTVQEEPEQLISPNAFGTVFEAVIEGPDEADTKAYADENLKVLWQKDDRVSIFNRFTYNREYKFNGETGDNSGSFSLVPNSDFITGNELNCSYAVYPYKESTSISNSGVLSVELPAKQSYAKGSFGRGANTMIAATEDNVLIFRNLCGYLMLKLYGEGLSVSSLSLTANGGESLAGTATVSMEPGGVPSADIAANGASSTITVRCEQPVALGASAEDYTEFWFALPPVTLSQGFTLSVSLSDGSSFEKSVTNSITINRNRRSRMSPLLVEPVAEPEAALGWDVFITHDITISYEALAAAVNGTQYGSTGTMTAPRQNYVDPEDNSLIVDWEEMNRWVFNDKDVDLTYELFANGTATIERKYDAAHPLLVLINDEEPVVPTTDVCPDPDEAYLTPLSFIGTYYPGISRYAETPDTWNTCPTIFLSLIINSDIDDNAKTYVYVLYQPLDNTKYPGVVVRFSISVEKH